MFLSYLFFLPVHLTVIAGDSIIQQLFYKNLLFNYNNHDYKTDNIYVHDSKLYT